MKLCSKCKVPNPPELFAKEPRNRDGLSSWCRKCCAEKCADYKKKNPEKIALKDRRWYAANRVRKSAANKDYREENHDRLEARRLKRVYGLTPDEAAAMVVRQKGVCAICVQPFGSGKGQHLDHCHVTKKVRGVLCQRCNMALGLLDDSPSRLRDAAAYLEATA